MVQVETNPSANMRGTPAGHTPLPMLLAGDPHKREPTEYHAHTLNLLICSVRIKNNINMKEFPQSLL